MKERVGNIGIFGRKLGIRKSGPKVVNKIKIILALLLSLSANMAATAVVALFVVVMVTWMEGVMKKVQN